MLFYLQYVHVFIRRTPLHISEIAVTVTPHRHAGPTKFYHILLYFLWHYYTTSSKTGPTSKQKGSLVPCFAVTVAYLALLSAARRFPLTVPLQNKRIPRAACCATREIVLALYFRYFYSRETLHRIGSSRRLLGRAWLQA
jgi:hypothetical protein